MLVVDDNRDAADMLTSLLAALGHESRAAYGARAALDTAQTLPPRRRLPRPQHARRRRHQPAAAAAGDFRRRGHVAALTGYGQQHDRDITREAGFQEHLTKPVDIDRLEATLAAAAAARRWTRGDEGRPPRRTSEYVPPFDGARRSTHVPTSVHGDRHAHPAPLAHPARGRGDQRLHRPARPATGNLVDLQIVDRGRGDVLSTWRHRGASRVAGRPGDRYALRLSNRTGGRVLVVLSVDGVNVVAARPRRPRRPATCSGPGPRPRSPAGARAIRSRGLLLHRPAGLLRRPHRPAGPRRRGRRCDLPRTRRPAGRRGRSNHSRRWPVPGPTARRAEPEGRARPGRGIAATPCAGERSATAPASPPAMRDRESLAKAEKLGTGHGEREPSPTTQTTFERASSQPNEIVQVRYDSHANLVAAGVIGRPQPPVAPQPFPGFVPDPS